MKETNSKSFFSEVFKSDFRPLFTDVLFDAKKMASILWSSKDLNKAFFTPGASWLLLSSATEVTFNVTRELTPNKIYYIIRYFIPSSA